MDAAQQPDRAAARQTALALAICSAASGAVSSTVNQSGSTSGLVQAPRAIHSRPVRHGPPGRVRAPCHSVARGRPALPRSIVTTRPSPTVVTPSA
jgi:hypothetical protein